MKWLYRILRLFKCPHKYIEDTKRYYTIKERGTGRLLSNITIKTCTRCGNSKEFRVSMLEDEE